MTKQSEQQDFSDEGIALSRQKINIQTGRMVRQADRCYRIVQLLDFESIIGEDVETGRCRPLRIGELRPVETEFESGETDLLEIGDEDWKIAEQRYAAIKPLLGIFGLSRDDVDHRARQVGVSPATLYRWLRRFSAYDSVSALVPKKRGWQFGKSRISPQAQGVIEQVIKSYYLTPQRPTEAKTVLEVQRLCRQKGIEAPSAGAVRARLHRLSEKQRLRGHGQREQAMDKFFPAPGKFPNADFPLAVVQIDHTPADVILVDDVYRRPIGRPWITLSIDVCTRVVTGYYLSFDPPSETSVAMCVAHSVLPKDEWLLLHKVDAKWPVWGFPKTIHVDNGADFRSNNFQQSCQSHGIHLEFRPVKQPRYGGHIERLLGTFLKEIHDLPGTTFSSVRERAEYDPEKHAVMTKSEFEEWLVTLICKVYHHRLHSKLGMSPMRKWEIGIFGNAQIQGIGLPACPADRFSVLLDFLPCFRRTVQTFGVTIDGLTYYAEALRPWINVKDPERSGVKREFVFRRDPRDISAVWFFDPDLKEYFKVPFADQSLPAMSVWEYQQAKEALRKEGATSVNQHQILQAITELRSKVEASQEKSKKARRQAQRRREHEKKISPAAPLAVAPPRQSILPAAPVSDLIEGDVDDFGDIA